MDKSEYFKRSQELNLPLRCPLVGYCMRWVSTVYFNSYYCDNKNKNRNSIDVLKENYELPSDFEEHKVESVTDFLRTHSSLENTFGKNVCPEVELFSSYHGLGMLPKKAISSYSWSKESGVYSIEYKHYSECLEFIQTEYKRMKTYYQTHIQNNHFKDVKFGGGFAGNDNSGDVSNSEIIKQ